ncbi:MAG TPA: twin-arginine translocation signal domain-containing protein [Burkholderiaceae bacterium]|nr:twin-arginine translocation signal domain-containing protein [Burkholderiaceae bacterium]
MKQKQAKAGRRGFLLGTGAAGAAGAIALASGGASRALPTQSAESSQKKDGYQLTEHVRKYYRTTLI